LQREKREKEEREREREREREEREVREREMPNTEAGKRRGSIGLSSTNNLFHLHFVQSKVFP
jgi:hypothetical protein